MAPVITDPQNLFPLYFEEFPPAKCPLRQAELIARPEFWDYFNSVQTMQLSDSDWQKIDEYENERIFGFKNYYDFDIQAHIFEYFPEFSGEFKRKDLDGLTRREKEKLEGESQKLAKESFLESLKVPKRSGLILRPDEVLEWLEDLIEFREQVSKDYQSLEEPVQTIAGIYLQKTDYTFFWYSSKIGRIISSYSHGSETERNILNLVSFGQPELYSKKEGSETTAEIDKFLWGRGEKLLFGRMVEEAEISQNNEEELLYSDIYLDGKQMASIAEKVFDIYSWADWKVELTPAQETFSVQSTQRKLKVPENSPRRLIKGLKTLAHEIEGHILTSVNEARIFERIKLYAQYMPDRFHPWAELSAKIVGAKTEELITGNQIEPGSLPYFMVCLREKAKGGDFKSCFDKFGESYAQVNGDLEGFGDYAFPRLLRIFRNFTPLDDNSGKITCSKDVAYLEQDVIRRQLEKRGLERLFFAGHLNVYILPVLKKLGLLEFEEIQMPKYVLAKQIWPKIRSGLEANHQIDEIIKEL